MNEPYRVAVVCLGNICRSPMAHVVLQARLEQAGLAEQVVVSSAGTGRWHVGEPMDERAARTLAAAGYDPSHHRARNFSIDWYAENDLLLAMDASNYADMADQAPSVAAREQLRYFREFDPIADPTDREVPDPWFGGPEGFEQVLDMVERTVQGLVTHLAELTAQRS